jgi:hypothetical protein
MPPNFRAVTVFDARGGRRAKPKGEFEMNAYARAAAVAALLLFSSGCATITRGTQDTLIVESDPPGADVTLSNGLSGKTPATFKLPRKETVVVKISRDGYEPVEINVVPQIVGAGAAGMAGNVILGGVIGAAVDAGTGSMKDLKPNPVSVKLFPLAPSVAETQPPLAPQPVAEVQPTDATPSPEPVSTVE